jgi:predicted RND superfamily exporter protein
MVKKIIAVKKEKKKKTDNENFEDVDNVDKRYYDILGVKRSMLLKQIWILQYELRETENKMTAFKYGLEEPKPTRKKKNA